MYAANGTTQGTCRETVPVIECHEVTKVYRSAWAGRRSSVCALDSVSWQVGRGTIVGLVGPNGAGKTTFLSLLAGLLFPTRGRIRVCGHPARSLGARRSLGYVPESPAFLSCYSARAVLKHHAALHGLPRRTISDEADRLLVQLRLAEYADRAVGGFSQGMKQRLALAVALLNRPQLLLLDEPSNGLDPIGVIELREVLSEVRQSGATIVISSHHLGELEKLTSEYVFLHRGRIVKFGGENAAGQAGRLRIDLLSGGCAITEEMLAPHHLLETSETRLIVAVGSRENVPDVVRRLVQGGARVAGVMLEAPNVEQTFVRLYQEKAL